MTDLVSRLSARALELCRLDSPIGQEKAIADHIETWAKGRFAAVDVLRHSHSLVVGHLGDSRPSVALIGHLDTVPPHPGTQPARIEGDRLIGLGSSDMKGALAVMMALAEDLPLPKLQVNLLLLFYEREEGPYLESGLGPLFQQAPALRDIRFAIAMEPTDNVVQLGCVGSLHATLRFFGAAAHSARPWQGENAIHKAGPLLAELFSLPRREVRVGGFTFYEVMSVTQASGGRARNVVPESFQLNLNYRFAPGKSVEEAQEEVRARVNGRAEVEFTDLAPSGRVCDDNPLLQKLLAVTGLPATSKQAWTDVARLASFGVDAVNFGPGETAQAHQQYESASLPALAEAYRKLELFLRAG
ncbi:MAG: succinyl-diaminopimelate desuccinylase [Myxococcota bacterium]